MKTVSLEAFEQLNNRYLDAMDALQKRDQTIQKLREEVARLNTDAASMANMNVRVAHASRDFNEIIDAIENRCMAADGPVTPTLQEMTESELCRLWKSVQKMRTALQERGESDG